MLISSFFTCNKDEQLNYKNKTKTIQLKFENNPDNKSKNNLDYTLYGVTINSLGEVELNNDNLMLVEALNEETGQLSFVIVENNNSSEQTSKTIHSKMQKTERGYFYDGECFVYGTMYYGDNGVNLFVPCGFNCIGYDDVCPDWDEGFA